MLKKLNLSVLILIKNEEIHLKRVLKQLSNLTNDIIVLDSFSTDDSLEIAKKFNCSIYQKNFTNYSDQLKWALENCNFKFDWILRIDADELLSKDFYDYLLNRKFHNKNIDTYNIKRDLIFNHHPIRYGGVEKVFLVRLWRKGRVNVSNDLVDEHLIPLNIDKQKKINFPIIDYNLKGLSFFIDKHIQYAKLEVEDLLLKRKSNLTIEANSSIIKKNKFKIYYSLPILIRPIFFFLYRVLILKGYKDGLNGFKFHLYQGLFI